MVIMVKLIGLLKEGKGCIIVTGHFGNWEYAGIALSAYGFPVNAVAKPLKSNSMDQFLNRCRQKTGVKIIYQQAFLPCIEITNYLKKMKFIYGSTHTMYERTYVPSWNLP